MTKKVRVLFDGKCRLCSREMNLYSHEKGSENLEFIDITSPEFDASIYGLSTEEVNKILHVIQDDGSVQKDINAFLAIWDTMPKYKYLRLVISLPIIKQISTLLYYIFALYIRPILPKRQQTCSLR